MSSRLLAMGMGAAQGFEKASSNLFNIMVAKEKLKRDKDQWELDNKIKGLQLKKAEHALSPDQLAMESEKLKAETAAAKSKYNLDLITIESKEREEREKSTQAQAVMGLMKTYAPDILRAGTDEGGVAYAPRGSGRPGAIPEIPEGISWEFGGAEFGRGKVQAPKAQERERGRIEQKVLKGEALSPQESKLYYGFQEGISLEDLERSFGISGGGGGLRDQAIAELEREGYPTTEANIKVIITQLKEQ